MKINQLLEDLIAGNNLTSTSLREMMELCMQGQLSSAQLAAFLALMRMKGESADELTTAAKVMKQASFQIHLGENLLDIVGTGGDGRNTFNVSTVASFVAAASGARVAKHGNRSVSSRSGSADLLTEAGFNLDLSEKNLKNIMQQCGITFLFAPHFHQALRHAREVRQELGIRTFFNLLGPLLNPAGANRQLVGVYAQSWLQPVAEVLANLGAARALVVHARDGLDEISISAETDVVEYRDHQFKTWSINPKEYGCYHANLDDITVNNPQESLKLAEKIFRGEKGPARDIILLNAGAALYCAEIASSMAEGVTKAAEVLDNGKAFTLFQRLRSLTHQLN